MKVINSTSAFNNWRRGVSSSRSIGFIPTMGALHSGHLSLVESSVNNVDITVVSIFVNPKQFSKDEDFDTYPRNVNNDLFMLNQHNVDVVFVPNSKDVYFNEEEDVFDDPFSKTLEGASRPHFFPGVFAVVSKLFNIVKPDFAYFGKKDAQQLLLIEKMVESLGGSIKIIRGETIREPGGLAMSSRNENLTKDQQKSAEVIFQSLELATKLLNNNIRNTKIIKSKMKNMISVEKNIKIDYISILHLDELIEVDSLITKNILLSVAVWIDNTRLIDNIFYEL